MEPDLRFARLARKAILEEKLEPLAEDPARRDATVDALAAAIGERTESRRSSPWRPAAIGVAAGVALALGATAWLHRQPTPNAAGFGARSTATEGSVRVLHAGSDETLVNGAQLEAGDRVLVARQGRAVLELASGTRLDVEEGGDLTLAEAQATQAFRLAAGAVRLRVAKLRAGERFLVRTADAEVEVHGTVFRVATAPSEPSCGSGSTTRVSVTEGVVTVRALGGEARLTAGESWPRDCSTPAPFSATEAAPAPSSPLVPSPASSPGSRTPRVNAAGPAETSALAAENDAVMHAIAAEREGDTTGALVAFDRFLATYPRSPLTETVLVERMKLLAKVDFSRGAHAAKEYLARYPHGYARKDAKGILGSEL